MSAADFIPNGFYLDGQTPVQHPVKIDLTDDAVCFRQPQSLKPTLWEFIAIDWDSTRHLPGQLRLKHAGPNDMWLVVTDETAIAAITAAKKIWSRRHFPAAHREFLTIARATAATLVICAALWLSWPYLAQPFTGLVPNSTRDWLSDTAQNILDLKRACRTPEGLAALQGMTDALTAGNPALRNARIIVVDSSLMNALTLPNDKILLTRALLAQANGPDEVAGIIAHELGHVMHRHILRNLLGQFSLQLLMLIFTGAHGDALGYVNNLTSLGHSRQFETDADATAIDLLRAAHIATRGLGEFFQRLQHNTARRGGEQSRYFSTHPPSDERAQLMLKTEILDARPALTPDAWRDLQNICGATPHATPDTETEDAPEQKPDVRPDTDSENRDI